MVQAAPNESRISGVVRSQRPDPERPGFVVLGLSVGACDPGAGPQLSALAPGQEVEVVARSSAVDALPTGVDLPVTANVRMAGPGIYVAQDLAVDPAAGPVVGSSSRGGSGLEPPTSSSPSSAPSGLREALRAALTSAMKAKDRTAVAAIRSALAAIDNAEAVPVGATATEATGPSSTSTAPVGTVGVGAADVPRRELSEADIETIVANGIRERRHAADEVEATHPDRAAQLRAEADVLASLARSASSGSR